MIYDHKGDKRFFGGLTFVSISDKRVPLVRSIHCGYGDKFPSGFEISNFCFFVGINSESLVVCSLKVKM